MIAELVAQLTDENGNFDITPLDKAIQSFVVTHNEALFFGVGVGVGVGVGTKHTLRTALDVTPVKKPSSPCLADKSYVYCPNETVPGNKPVEVGYAASCLNAGVDNWSIPLSMLRCSPWRTYNEIGVEQVREFAQLPQNQSVLIVNSADAGYGCPQFIAPLYPEKNLVNVARLKNRNVWVGASRTKTGGANGVYGASYALRTEEAVSKRKNPITKEIAEQKASIFSLVPDKIEEYTTFTTKKKKEITVELQLYNNMMLRSTGGHNMKDKPFDLVIVSLRDTITGEKCYQRPIYLAVCGQQRAEISLRAAYQEHYAYRYDIEPNNRFMKQQLLLDKYQTPIAEHFDVSLRIIQLTEWLLFAASTEVVSEPKKWQKSGDKPANDKGRLSIAQTRKAAQTLFSTFDQTPFLPQISNKGKGRVKGTTLPPKKKYPVVKKAKKAKKTPAKPVEIVNTT